MAPRIHISGSDREYSVPCIAHSALFHTRISGTRIQPHPLLQEGHCMKYISGSCIVSLLIISPILSSLKGLKSNGCTQDLAAIQEISEAPGFATVHYNGLYPGSNYVAQEAGIHIFCRDFFRNEILVDSP